jgi:type IV pilus assembly protein PilN
MRFDINLATRPYQDAREFWLRWGTALGIASILSLALLVTTISGWYNARRDRATIADLRQNIAQRDRLRAQAEEFLSRPENRTTRDQAQILNALIERKAFSWTRVLEDMEKVMPPGVHVVSIHPELDEDNQLAVKMVVAGTSSERAIELAHRMEESRRFTQTAILSQRFKESAGADPASWEFDLAAIYIAEPFVETAPASDTPVPPKKTPAKPPSPGRKS